MNTINSQSVPRRHLNKSVLGVSLTTATLLFALHSATSEAAINLCEGLVTHKKSVKIENLAKPEYMKPFIDPAFGAKITRISRSRNGEIYKPLYSTVQAWNADESLLILYHRNDRGKGRHVLLDGKTYKPYKELDIWPTDLEEVFWSHTDPNVLFYVNKYKQGYGDLYEFNVHTGERKILVRLGEMCSRNNPTSGGDTHMPSIDDDLFGFRCQAENGDWIMMSYRRSTNELNVTPLTGSKWDNWTAPVPAPSGKSMWLQGDVIPTNLTKVLRTLDLPNSHGHSNFGLTHDGKDAYFQVAFDPSPRGCNRDKDDGVGHLVVHELDTGKCRTIISEAKGYPYTTSSTHISSQAYKQPGWVVLSSVGYPKQIKHLTNPKKKATPLFSEIYMANTDPDNAVVCRLAHHRTFGKHAKNDNYNSYFGEPHPTISPSGTRIVFGSDWYDSGSVDTYVIELPAYQP